MSAKFSLSSIALGNIRGRRRQYILLTGAIVLAIYFVATMLLFASTMFTSLRERHYQRFGEQDVIIFNAAREPLAELMSSGILTDDYGEAAIYGYVLPDGQSKANGFSVAVFDENALALARKDLLAGRLPERAGEIALEQSMLARLRTEAAVGDTVTLTLAIPDGVNFKDSTVQKSFKLVGVVSDKLIYLDEWNSVLPVYRDFPAGILSAAEEITLGGKTVINIYGRYAAPSSGFKQMLDFYFNHEELQNEGSELPFEDTRYVLLSDNFSDEDIFITYLFLIIIALVLVLAACLGIINAFTSNLEARKQQLGLLRAVGATKKQLREILGRETSLLALFSIPLALLLASLTVWSLTKAMGESYIFRPNILVIIGVAAAGLLCVRLAASIPLRAAAKVPPMQAIRNVELARKMRKSKIVSQQLFDVPLLLAKRNRTLYQSKQLGIKLSPSVPFWKCL
ncbi:MAG: ABC transporter permease [Firmicutes bacterium]|nr:ABC transporter permease [Bacillota bacterium]